MNPTRPSTAIVSYAFRTWLTFRRLFYKQKCRAFDCKGDREDPSIDMIFVINLDRATSRWLNMQREFKHILDSSGYEVLKLTERYAAVDAKQFSIDPTKDDEIDPFYTLEQQLFVEPQPLVLPTRFELNTPIQMSRTEVAVAQSHINIWKKVATGNHEYVLILEDDTWFRSRFAQSLDKAWSEIMQKNEGRSNFDVLYVSYHEVKHGAPKSFVSNNVFDPFEAFGIYLGIFYLAKVPKSL